MQQTSYYTLQLDRSDSLHSSEKIVYQVSDGSCCMFARKSSSLGREDAEWNACSALSNIASLQRASGKAYQQFVAYAQEAQPSP
jgi:hypothetical protein